MVDIMLRLLEVNNRLNKQSSVSQMTEIYLNAIVKFASSVVIAKIFCNL